MKVEVIYSKTKILDVDDKYAPLGRTYYRAESSERQSELHKLHTDFCQEIRKMLNEDEPIILNRVKDLDCDYARLIINSRW